MYLEVDSILKSYGDRPILTDVSLNLEVGDITAIWGRNGSGKSTLLKIIFGSESAEHKFIRINDKVIKRPAYTNGLISYLSQDHFIPNNLPVSVLLERFDIVALDGQIKDKLGTIKTSKIADLSSGELRLLEVLFVLNNDTPFVLLDEPFVGMSPVMCEQLCEYIRLASKHKGIIVTDHNYTLVEKIANKHYLLEEGYLKPITSKDDLKRHYLI